VFVLVSERERERRRRRYDRVARLNFEKIAKIAI
jgi:hypothetical protein